MGAPPAPAFGVDARAEGRARAARPSATRSSSFWAARETAGGEWCRCPRASRCSTWITSAPRSASHLPARGPAQAMVKSSTRTPFSIIGRSPPVSSPGSRTGLRPLAGVLAERRRLPKGGVRTGHPERPLRHAGATADPATRRPVTPAPPSCSSSRACVTRSTGPGRNAVLLAAGDDLVGGQRHQDRVEDLRQRDRRDQSGRPPSGSARRRAAQADPGPGRAPPTAGRLATPRQTHPSLHGTGPRGLKDSACRLPARRLITPWWVYSTDRPLVAGRQRLHGPDVDELALAGLAGPAHPGERRDGGGGPDRHDPPRVRLPGPELDWCRRSRT